MQFYVFNLSSDKVSVNYSLSLGLLNSEHKRLVKKKRSTKPVSDRSTGVHFEFSRSGRVEKILTGSISATDNETKKYGVTVPRSFAPQCCPTLKIPHSDAKKQHLKSTLNLT